MAEQNNYRGYDRNNYQMNVDKATKAQPETQEKKGLFTGIKNAGQKTVNYVTNNPGKSALIVAGTAVAVTGGIYLFKQIKAHSLHIKEWDKPRFLKRKRQEVVTEAPATE